MLRKFLSNSVGAILLGAIIGMLIAACTSLEKPQGVTEQVAYAEAGAQGAIKTLVDLTCVKYAAGACVDPTKVLHPAQAQLYLASIEKSREALRAVSTMPANGVGNCLGQVTSQTACLQLAQSLLTQVQRVLAEQVKKGGAT